MPSDSYTKRTKRPSFPQPQPSDPAPPKTHEPDDDVIRFVSWDAPLVPDQD